MSAKAWIRSCLKHVSKVSDVGISARKSKSSYDLARIQALAKRRSRKPATTQAAVLTRGNGVRECATGLRSSFQCTNGHKTWRLGSASENLLTARMPGTRELLLEPDYLS